MHMTPAMRWLCLFSLWLLSTLSIIYGLLFTCVRLVVDYFFIYSNFAVVYYSVYFSVRYLYLLHIALVNGFARSSLSRILVGSTTRVHHLISLSLLVLRIVLALAAERLS